MKKVLLSMAMLLSCAAALAEMETTAETKTKLETSETTNLDNSRVHREFWGLSSEEWDRYQVLAPLAQQLGQNTAEATPLEVLAIFAESDQERDRYAKAFAKRLDQYVKNLQAMNRAVSKAQASLYAGIPMIDPDQVNALREVEFRKGDRIQYFTETDCVECEAVLRKLIRQVRLYKINMDVFFVDASKAEINAFAKEHIPEKLIHEGRVTLNPDDGFVERYDIQVPAPYISYQGGDLKIHDPDL